VSTSTPFSQVTRFKFKTKVDEMKNAFKAHLKKEQNIENFEFLQEIRILEKIKLPTDQIQKVKNFKNSQMKKVKEIYETFIKIGGEKEMNIFENV
jgi:hypothetical protein